MASPSGNQSIPPSSLFDIGSIRNRVMALETELLGLQQAMQQKENFLRELEDRVVVCEQLAGVGVDFSDVTDYYGVACSTHERCGQRGRLNSDDTRDTDDNLLLGRLGGGVNDGGPARVLGYKYTLGSDISNIDSMSMVSGGGSPSKKVNRGGANAISKRKADPKYCTFEGCHKMAHGPTYLFCLRHGGGYRCQEEGCTRSAYSTKYCSRHGGGPRCQWDGCGKGAISNSSYCRRHGGGSRCQHPNCPEGARQGFNFCLNHGGFNPCAFPNCPGIALLTSSYCRQHNAIAKVEGGGEDSNRAVASLM